MVGLHVWLQGGGGQSEGVKKAHSGVFNVRTGSVSFLLIKECTTEDEMIHILKVFTLEGKYLQHLCPFDRSWTSKSKPVHGATSMTFEYMFD